MPSIETSRVRRDEIRRKSRADSPGSRWRRLHKEGIVESIFIAGVFFIVATMILSLRQGVMHYRPGQWISHDIVSRVAFRYNDPDQLLRAQRDLADQEPRVYQLVPNTDIWGSLEQSAGPAGPHRRGRPRGVAIGSS
jgi:hypothetical protein